MYRVYDILVDDQRPPRMVVNIKPTSTGGAIDREAALDLAAGEARAIGWTKHTFTRVARTPSGGWSITVERA
jgi:hypothetical protein